ncbi:MAG: hypothetical protein WBA12_14965, partial [Catalinimonas sp.]
MSIEPSSRWRVLLCGLFPLFFVGPLAAQFAPPAGRAGSTALFRDSSAVVGWAAGEAESATGPADGFSVVSLGDGGTATCTFERPITDGPGPDFAVFENGFQDTFLELAFVEVSSDGVRFVRFPATSLTDTTTQVGAFGTLDATKLDNLAGKYRANWATPFDLAQLRDSAGLDVTRVTHVRLRDVVGSVDPAYATRDAAGRPVNDPWPTPFPTGGFDLDAVGVLHFITPTAAGAPVATTTTARLYPNPVRAGGTLYA